LAAGEIEEAGVLLPEACIEPHEFFYELLSRNIRQLKGWIEEPETNLSRRYLP
jgi:hypothetical protein